MDKKLAFLSYCHADMHDKQEVMKYLQGTLENYGFSLWHDGEILTGDDFMEEVKNALEECSVFICLISQDYLTSNVCMNVELKAAIQQGKIDKTHIFPIILKSCTWKQYVFKDILCQPTDGKPLNKFDDKDECLVDVNEQLVRVLENLKKKSLLIEADTSPLKKFRDSLLQLSEKIKHYSKDYLDLEDIFVYPHLRVIDEQKDLVDASQIVETPSNVFIIGSEHSGKTTLSNKVTLELLDKGIHVLRIDGSDINEYCADKLFQKLKKRSKTFCIGDSQKKAIIVDDLNEIKFNDKYLEEFISSCVQYFDYVYFFCEEREFYANSTFSTFSSIKFYKIQSFGYVKRDELYSKWLRVGNEDIQTLTNNEYHYRIDEIAAYFESVMRHNILEPKPTYILTVLQAGDNFSDRNYSLSSLGECYNVLLHSLLSRETKYKGFDAIINFLSFLAFQLYKTDKDYFSQEELNQWLEMYKEKFLEIDGVIDILINANILYLHEYKNYRFSQKYIYYYCAAKFISDNYVQMSDIVSDLCQNLNNERKANILIFLVHHARSVDLTDTIILHSAELLNDIAEFKMLQSPVEFFKGYLSKVNHEYTVDSTQKNREEILKTKDNLSQEKESLVTLEQEATKQLDKYISEDKAIAQQLKLMHEANSAIRSIEVIGQVLKNRYGSLPTAQLEYAIEQSQVLAFKIVQFFVDSLILTEDEMTALISKAIVENENVSELQAIDKAKKYIRYMAFNLSYFMVDLVSKSMALKEIESVIQKVCDNQEKPSFRLINLSVKLRINPKSLPKEYIEELIKEEHNVFFKKLLNQVIYNHMYLYELDYKDLQWISDKLEIEVRQPHFTKGTKMIEKNSTNFNKLNVDITRFKKS